MYMTSPRFFFGRSVFLNVDRQGEGGTLAVNIYIIQPFDPFGKGL